MKIEQVVALVIVGLGLSSLTGCMHGETFGEWKSQLLDNDPWSVDVVEPNDTKVDEVNKEFLDQVRRDMEQRGKFRKDVRFMPSQNVNAFLNSPRAGGKDENRRLLVSFGGKLMGAFASIKDFNIVGTEEELQNSIAMPTVGFPTAEHPTYTLAFNILNLPTPHPVLKKKLVPSLNGLHEQTITVYTGEISASVALINPQGEQRLNLTANAKVDDIASEELAEEALIVEVVNKLLGAYAEKVSPPAYVSQLRGNGLFAEVTLGSGYGIQSGTKVEFYHDVRTTDFVTGKPKVSKTVVATGTVIDGRYVSENSSWVKIELFHYRKVHLGTFVRVMRVGE